eukprot:TRINITY_DN23987_c0_g1_i4.p1 TRINITY_DN23987_c0_g1~~TRINITY_DN23987_c0_g1_i4.p1  ORF type:complete len:261 (-),score=40.83 TRINITY_DN23987_c0_g1_i4:308-1090(-)
MQGGHPDDGCLDLLPGQRIGRDGIRAEVESELSIPSFELVPVQDWKGSRLDKGIQLLRRSTAALVGNIIALSCGCGTVESFRAATISRVESGCETVRWVQLHRTKFLDTFLSGASFCAEEEFYLLVLPLMYWNVDWQYGYHMLFVVCIGLFFGNFLKDVFQLPRPTGVWRSSAAAAADSTACMDFGFPSTHTMNSISNAGFTLLYAYDPLGLFLETKSEPSCSFPLWAALVLVRPTRHAVQSTRCVSVAAGWVLDWDHLS